MTSENTSKIGFWSSLSLVIGNMIGSGIFLLPATLAIYGGISLIGWLCSSIGAILLALVFGYLSKLKPNTTGGPYAYTRLGLGEFPAYLVAWGYWVSIWCTNAAIAVALVGYLKVFFPTLSNPIYAIVTGLFFIWLFTWINSKPLKTVGLVQLVTTVLKVVPIILIGFIGIFYVQSDLVFAPNLSGESSIGAITATTTLTLFAFLGMESATIPGANVENSAKNIKRATIAGTIITILVYLLSSAAIMGIIPQETLAKSSAPFADAAANFWGESAKYVVAAGAVIATMGALNGWILIQGQIPMAAAKDKLFPKIFGKTNKNNSPIAGIILSSILVSVLMLLNYSKTLSEAFAFMMTLSTLSVITPYVFSIASLGILLRKNDHKEKNNIKLLVAFMAFCFSIWIILGAGEEVVFWGFILLMLGVPFYVVLKRNKP